MALSEIALLGLAWNLAANPSAADIQQYQSLSQAEQIRIQDLVDQKDKLPEELEKLKQKTPPKDVENVNQAPTSETSSGI
ncbi:MAG TPA: hypothetical protein VF412_16970 [Bdellovibrio sp.]|uniref:hypothetical protein n=1 Tax=Bdellovibrio sp. TaxID=28201 RepID=UPI002EE87B5E